jgi:hypothetical protein
MSGLLPSQFSFRSFFYLTLMAIAAGIILLYILFQARFLIQGPQLALIDEPESVQNSQVVHLRGTARNITKISLNGRQIFTDKAGYFDEALVLENGYTVATIQATDRYGRTASIVKQFVYTPTSIIPE